MRENCGSVQFYSDRVKDLLHTQQHKIEKFLEHKCINYLGQGKYYCHFIEGYNNTTYIMEMNADKDFECNCQAFQSAKKKGGYFMCSHLGALYEFFARKQTYKE